jgi:hypothetical protein
VTFDDDDEEIAAEPSDTLAILAAINRFARGLAAIPWYARVGRPLTEEDRALARQYVDGLGFPDIDVSLVESWFDAADVAENPGVDTAVWEAEEQATAALVTAARERIPDDELAAALSHVSAMAVAAAHQALTALAQGNDGPDDPAVCDAAAGAAAKAGYQAALLLAVGGDADHPLAGKFLLFERGRWPIDAAGRTLSLF